ncbi:MAG: hypothetical protein K0R94_1299 [Burkholderiales bacterium]|jgi:hypothetical protein|nr:hypothetical protein [Burkholderiales bacterium]
MLKLIFGLLFISAASAFAAQNNLFQEFDNQVSIGYGMWQNTSGYGTSDTVPINSWVYSTSNILNLEAERLMDNGIWIDVNANMAFGSGPVNQNPIIGSNGGTYQLSDYGVNGKVGYAFTLANQHLQITPYIALGINNLANSVQYKTSTGNLANSFAYLGGAGARLEYRINSTILVFGDQLVAYSWDQSGPRNGIAPQNEALLTSTLGAKFNLTQNFQLGVRGIYTNTQPQATNSSPGGYMMQSQNAFGGLVTVGLNY